jgi:hypothetical protein
MLSIVVLWLGCGAGETPSQAPVPPSVPVVPAAPPPAPGPIELAVVREIPLMIARLTEAERAIRDPATDDARAAQWGHLQQRLYRAMAEDPVMGQAIVEGMPEDLRKNVESCWFGTREIARTVRSPKTDLPDWKIVAPPPPDELKGYYLEAQAKYGVPWTVLASIHLNETRMGRLRGVSDAGARGPMQFMPQTWAEHGLGGDIEAARDAILAAGNYVAAMGWSQDKRKALWAYNHTEHYVNAVLAFADVMERDELAYRGLWGWQVYYRTIAGSIWLEEGYEQSERISIETYCTPRGEPHCPKLHE